MHQISQPYNPNIAETILVWAIPRSLAATSGITVVFFSSGYLDVSVPRVCLPIKSIRHIFHMPGCPIRKSTDHNVCAITRSLSQLITSFIASESLGIPHTPLIRLLYFLCSFVLMSIIRFYSKIKINRLYL